MHVYCTFTLKCCKYVLFLALFSKHYWTLEGLTNWQKLGFSLNCIERKSGNGILLPKLFSPTVRKKCSSDREKLLKFEAEGREFLKFLRSLEQFIQTVKGQNNFC